MQSPFLLQIVEANSRQIAIFPAGDSVERELAEAISRAVHAKTGEILKAVQARGRWWLRPDHFDAAVDASLKEALPGVVAAAVDAVLLEFKLEVTKKYLG